MYHTRVGYSWLSHHSCRFEIDVSFFLVIWICFLYRLTCILHDLHFLPFLCKMDRGTRCGARSGAGSRRQKIIKSHYWSRPIILFCQFFGVLRFKRRKGLYFFVEAGYKINVCPVRPLWALRKKENVA